MLLELTELTPYRAFSFLMFFVMWNMSALYDAYAEYLDRMLDESDDLTLVDSTSVPADVNIPLLLEWAELAD